MARRRLIVGLVAGLCLGGVASAQVVREDGVKSIAGVVGDGIGFREWIVNTEGNEIVFASLDAFVYEQRVPHETMAAEGGGCSGEEGGPSRLCLQVINSANQVVCHAKRPTPPPGWQRDPRLACPLSAGTYRIRVIQVSMGEHEGISCADYDEVGLVGGEPYPFLLNISLRRIAPSGVNIQAAIAQSLSRF